MKLIAFVVSFALAACLLPSIGAAAELVSNQSTYTAPVANDSARAELVSFLEEARNYTLNNGKDEAFKAFNDPKGSLSEVTCSSSPMTSMAHFWLIPICTA